MAPEICSESSGGRRRLRPEKPNRHATLQSRAHLARRPPRPAIQPGPCISTVPDPGRGPVPLARARGRRGCDDGRMSADIVIRGGTVVDGTGLPVRRRRRRRHRRPDQRHRRRPARATACSTRPARSSAPGFIDIHTHYDAQVFWDPDLTPSSFHGVTTVVAGNCGFSIAPDPPRRRGAAGAHAPARGGHELRHAGRRRALGRVRDVPPVPRRRGGAGHGAQLRLLRRPHRRAALRHGRGRLRAPGHRRRDRADAGGGGRGHGRRRRRLRLERVADPQRRQRPAGAVAGGRPGRAARPARAGQAVRARRGGAAARAASSPTRRSSGSSARSGAPSPGRRCSR